VEFTENSPEKSTEFLPNPQRASAKVRMWLGLKSRAAVPEGYANTHFQGCTAVFSVHPTLAKRVALGESFQGCFVAFTCTCTIPGVRRWPKHWDQQSDHPWSALGWVISH